MLGFLGNALVTLVICLFVGMTVASFRLKHFPEFYFEGWSVRTTGTSWLIEMGLCSIPIVVFLASLKIEGRTSYAVSYSVMFFMSGMIWPFIIMMKKRSNELRSQHRDEVHSTWSTDSRPGPKGGNPTPTEYRDLGEGEIIGACGQKEGYEGLD